MAFKGKLFAYWLLKQQEKYQPLLDFMLKYSLHEYLKSIGVLTHERFFTMDTKFFERNA
jgi:hypothetical protein